MIFVEAAVRLSVDIIPKSNFADAKNMDNSGNINAIKTEIATIQLT